MPVAFLPFEILAAIFEEVIDLHDLRNARLASRTSCAAAMPIAFRHLSVIATRTSAQNLGRLFDVPYIAAHVRVVSYHDTGTDRKGRILKYGASSSAHPAKRYHDTASLHLFGGSNQSELVPSENWKVRFLASISCPGLRPST